MVLLTCKYLRLSHKYATLSTADACSSIRSLQNVRVMEQRSPYIDPGDVSRIRESRHLISEYSLSPWCCRNVFPHL